MTTPALAVLLLLGAGAARGQTVGSSPGQIFSAGASARALGMGSAFTAVADDASSLYYNPAGLGALSQRRAEAMHAALYGGAAFDYLGYSQNLPHQEAGWSLEALRLGVGGIDGRDAADDPTGTLGYSELGLGAGFGLADVAVDGLSLGAGVKMDERSLAGESNRLFGADAGAQYGPFLDERATVGLALQNLLSVAQGATEDRLAPSVRLGAAVQVADPLLVTADVSNVGDVRAGAEYRFGPLALRAGWTSGGPTFGGGVLVDHTLSFDVAVLDSPTLGTSERFSMGYRFGAYKSEETRKSAVFLLIQALDALHARDYLKAGQLLDQAVAEDPAVGRLPRIEGGDWKRKAQRLHRLLDGLALEAQPDGQDELKAPTVPADLAEKAIADLIEESRFDDAMLLSEVAAGEAPRDSVFSRLPQAMAQAAGQGVARSQIMPVAAFIEDRQRRTNAALYAKRYSAAVEACRQVTLVVPDNALAWERLGSAYYRAGEARQAAAAYARSLKLDPSNARLREFIQTRLKPADLRSPSAGAGPGASP